MTLLRVMCAGVLCMTGCSADPAASGTGMTGDGGTGNGSGGATGTGSTPGTGSTTGTGGVFEPFPNSGGAGGAVNPDECERVTQMAEAQMGGRADIVVIVDNSGSMGDENLAVQTNLNRFSTQITMAGIDVHVVLISGGPAEGGAPWDMWFGGGNGICLEPPLGLAGACPNGDDTNLPGYMHWRQTVGSTDALSVIQNTFSGWQGMLRPDAAKTFVIITDDESDMPAQDFANWVNAQPVFASGPVWKYSGIYCITSGANCANIGGVHNQLTMMTGGIVGDLATFATGMVDAQFQTVFDTLGDAVVADARPVECEWGIPPVPAGEVFDRNKVNVEYTSSTTMMPQVIYKIANEAACTPDVGGWFYDDDMNPSRVRVCPSSCAVMQADDGARVDVVFGCQSEEPPIR